MKRYLIVAADFVRTGGMDRANYALAKHLARSGHETHLVSFRVAAELVAEPAIRAHIIPRPGGRNALGAPLLGAAGIAYAAHLGGNVCAIVNGGNCPLAGAVNWIHYVQRTDAKLRSQSQRSPKKWIARATEHVALKRARLLIANSERTRADLIRDLRVAPSRIRVIYYGSDSREFRVRNAAERAAIRESLGWDRERLKALFVGALGDDRKGFDVLYTVWRSLCRMPDWDVDLVVVGTGRLLDAWRARAANDGLASRVTFLGFRQDVPLITGASDLLIAPSRYEAYGLGVHEALCSGVAAITSARSGVAEVFPSELSDYLIPDPEDVVDLGNRIQRWRASRGSTETTLAKLSNRLAARTWEIASAEIASLFEP
jgi:glycosyltransferase involved in cell wall biosynthesis